SYGEGRRRGSGAGRRSAWGGGPQACGSATVRRRHKLVGSRARQDGFGSAAPQGDTRKDGLKRRCVSRFGISRAETEPKPMEARATAKFIRVSPQKARLVIDLIRGKNAGEAINILRFTKKRVSGQVEKVLRSAIANAEQKSETLDVDRLVVSRAYVDEGPRLKRVRPAPMGRAYRYQRRMSHITVVVEEPER